MSFDLGVLRGARRLGFAAALCVCAWSAGVLAQAAPGSAPPPAAGTPTDAPPNTPPPGAEPAPLGQSPLLDDQPADATTPPPAPSYEPPPPPPPAPAEEEAPPRRTAGPFARGGIRLSVLIGSGWTVTDEYLILGAGVGYYLVDGLELGLDYEAWIFGSPVMHRVSPGLKYVFHMVPVIKPYIGGFYRHTFVNDYDDFNYLGARAGLFYAPAARGAYFGLGAVYEHLLNCKNSAFVDCDDVYPEIFVGVSL